MLDTLLWPGYFAGMQNELFKTINFTLHFPRGKMLNFIQVLHLRKWNVK